MATDGRFCVEWNSILSRTWEDGVDGLTVEFRGPQSIEESERLEEFVVWRKLETGGPDVELEWRRPLITPYGVLVSLCGPTGAAGNEVLDWLWVVSQVAPGKVWVHAAERMADPKDSGHGLALAFVPAASDDEDGPSTRPLSRDRLIAITELMVEVCMDCPGPAALHDPITFHDYPVERDHALNWMVYQAGRRDRSVGLQVSDDDTQVQRGATLNVRAWPGGDATTTRRPTMASIVVSVDDSWSDSLAVLLERLPGIAARSHQAFIRPVRSIQPYERGLFERPAPPTDDPTPTFWMPDHAHLIPDVHGIQVLTDRQVQATVDLSDWDVSEIGPDRHLVQAHDLDDWLDPDGPPTDVLDAGRAAFGPDVIRMTNGR